MEKKVYVVYEKMWYDDGEEYKFDPIEVAVSEEEAEARCKELAALFHWPYSCATASQHRQLLL